MTLVFLLEEESMRAFLQGLLPRVLPPEVRFRLIPHEGKQDLERSIPRKLRAWQTPDTWFVVVRDQDRGECDMVADRLRTLCETSGRPDTLVRIACRELESWFLGDLEAVAEAYDRPALAALQSKRKYRSPDEVAYPSDELRTLVPGYGKVSGARLLGHRLDPNRCCSPSFAAFVRGLDRLVREAQP